MQPTIIDAGIVVALFSAVVACYVTLTKRVQDNEDCIEGKLEEFSKTLNDFKIEVAERLTAIETHLKGGID